MLCELVECFQHTLKHYFELSVVKRVEVNTDFISHGIDFYNYGTIFPEAWPVVLKKLLSPMYLSTLVV